MKPPVALLCFLGSVKNDFLPPDLLADLNGLFPNLIQVATSDAWKNDADFFQRVEPEILITGWGTPRLPEHRQEIPSVKYVCHLSGTVKAMLPRTLLEEGVLVTNWGNCHAATVAECALLLVLSTLRKVVESNLVMHVEKGWIWPTSLRPSSLYGKRVGLHGFGAVARCLLPLLEPFGVSIAAYSEGVPPSVFSEAGVRQAESLEELFSSSDVLVEVEAANAKNLGSVTEMHLRSLPDGAVFINVGRAAIVDERAFLLVASEGKLQIGLDVYHQEPLAADSPLRGLHNVCLLGHQAGPTPDRLRDCGRFALDNLTAYLAGLPLKGTISLEAYDRAT